MRKKKLSTIDKILIFCAVLLILFTVTMIILFAFFQTVPDTLITCFFACFGVESINTVRIWKEKRKESKNDNWKGL